MKSTLCNITRKDKKCGKKNGNDGGGVCDAAKKSSSIRQQHHKALAVTRTKMSRKQHLAAAGLVVEGMFYSDNESATKKLDMTMCLFNMPSL